MFDLLCVPLLAGYGIALIAAPLGCFVVWRRMAYFGDTLAHASLLGVALGLLLNINLTLSITLCSVCIAISLMVLKKKAQIATDTLLGILAHSSLALGLVAISLTHNVRVDLMGYLFGDILAVFPSDLYWIYAIVLIGGIMIGLLWNSLVSVAVHEELAQVEGIPSQRINLYLTIMLALTIAFFMKIIGILLITALLIIPPASVQFYAKSPEKMVFLSALVGCLSVTCGLLFSWYLDTSAGPSIVLCSFLIFLLGYIIENIRTRKYKKNVYYNLTN